MVFVNRGRRVEERERADNRWTNSERNSRDLRDRDGGRGRGSGRGDDRWSDRDQDRDRSLSRERDLRAAGRGRGGRDDDRSAQIISKLRDDVAFFEGKLSTVNTRHELQVNALKDEGLEI